ncbi:MAG: hypothetical protein QG635_2296 [Bacteroidota bacterium]|nr:hypothetical protein [Bacteroidota bacterium]
MYTKLVRDLMIPVNMYPTIHQSASMLDAMMVLKKANENITPGQKPFRAVLVKNDDAKIVGKIGHIAFLKALEPKYKQIFDMEKLARVALSSGFIDSMLQQFSLWETGSLDLCAIVAGVKAQEIMNPIEQHIDENESIANAIHKIIMWQTLSILVTRGIEIVGIIRLSDLYDSIEDYVINSCNQKKGI